MQITLKGIKDQAAEFKKAGISLPAYDVEKLQQDTPKHPKWVHVGPGNIFNGFIGSCAQQLLNEGKMDSGIIGVEVHTDENLEKLIKPHDYLKLNVVLLPDTSVELEILGSVTNDYVVNGQFPESEQAVRGFFKDPKLQILSFTITEKGYALKDIKGEFLPQVKEDFANGPDKCRNVMALTTALLFERFKAGAFPIAVLSMDNCSHNGDKLKDSVLTVAKQWQKKGFVPADFIAYVSDEKRVSFPWSMIDKITPRPDPEIAKKLKEMGIEGMDPIKTSRGTFIAPFVNAEKPQYLVVEDKFPNGRPPLEQTGILFTTGEKVDLCERMKVTTCLNPLHTAMAVYGCILGYGHIYEEMDDPLIVKLVNTLGYDEGLKVVEDPEILSPRDFLTEVITQRLTNRCLPDTPQRIATDTSLKVPVRFGETLKNYKKRDLDSSKLTALPLAIAGWIRYLMAIDDAGKPFELSDDPQAPTLREYLKDVKFGDPASVGNALHPILENASLFGVNLYENGLGQKIEELFKEEIAGPGAVKATLKKYLG